MIPHVVTFFSPSPTIFDLNISTIIDSKVQFKFFSFPRRRFNSQHFAARTQFTGCQQCVKTMMGTEIQDHHARPKEPLHKRAFRVLEPTVKQCSPDKVVSCRPPTLDRPDLLRQGFCKNLWNRLWPLTVLDLFMGLITIRSRENRKLCWNV